VSLPIPPPPTSPYDESRSWRREVTTAAVIVVAFELVALPLGLLWGHLAPHPQYSVGGHQLNLVIGDAKPLVRGDFYFLLVTGAAGIISGFVVYLLARKAEIGATIGLAVGGLLAGWLAWRIGHAWTGGTQPISLALSPDNTKVRLAADLHARIVLISWAVAGVAVHGLIYAVTWPTRAKTDALPALEAWPAPAGPPIAD
jgi:hypothetical protein